MTSCSPVSTLRITAPMRSTANGMSPVFFSSSIERRRSTTDASPSASAATPLTNLIRLSVTSARMLTWAMPISSTMIIRSARSARIFAPTSPAAFHTASACTNFSVSLSAPIAFLIEVAKALNVSFGVIPPHACTRSIARTATPAMLASQSTTAFTSSFLLFGWKSRIVSHAFATSAISPMAAFTEVTKALNVSFGVIPPHACTRSMARTAIPAMLASQSTTPFTSILPLFGSNPLIVSHALAASEISPMAFLTEAANVLKSASGVKPPQS